jgi:hypothetical protein
MLRYPWSLYVIALFAFVYHIISVYAAINFGHQLTSAFSIVIMLTTMGREIVDDLLMCICSHCMEVHHVAYVCDEKQKYQRYKIIMEFNAHCDAYLIPDLARLVRGYIPPQVPCEYTLMERIARMHYYRSFKEIPQ